MPGNESPFWTQLDVIFSIFPLAARPSVANIEGLVNHATYPKMKTSLEPTVGSIPPRAKKAQTGHRATRRDTDGQFTVRRSARSGKFARPREEKVGNAGPRGVPRVHE